MLALEKNAYIGAGRGSFSKDTLREQMSRNLIIVEGAYADSIWKDKPFSVSLPHEMTDFEMLRMMDGDQPSYRNSHIFQQVSQDAVGYVNTVADYPVTGDTLRFGFKSREDAEKFLDAVMKLPVYLYE